MHSFFNQPYPWMYKGKGLWILAGAIFVMALFFNFAFEPFNVYREEHRFSYFTVCLIQALIAAAISLCTMSLAGLFINDTPWKVKKEAMLILFLLILIGTGMFLGREIVYDNPDNFSAKYFWEELRNTSLVGSFFFMIFIPLNYRKLTQKHNLSASTLKLHNLPPHDKKGREIKIRTQCRTEDFYLNPEDLIYAKAEGNYLELHVVFDNTFKRLVKRLTLKELEQHLASFPFIVRTHRSYIVNTDKVTKVAGNAQGYLLTTCYPFPKLPVSRSMISGFNARFSQ